MKHLVKIAGLCLASMLVLGMAITATASAAPHWLVCLKENLGTTTTKWASDQCKEAVSGGGWEWSELKGTEPVRSHASLRLADTKIPLVGTVSVSCTGEGVGSVGPKQFDRTTEINSIKCVPGENCEKIEKEVKPLNLPWQTELYETEGKIRDKVRAENGKGAGWAVTCRVALISKTDECDTEEGSTSVENSWTKGIGKGELLVLANFDAKSTNATCSVGGNLSGEVRGPIATLLESGQALSVSK